MSTSINRRGGTPPVLLKETQKMRFKPLLILSAAFTLLSHPARSAEVEFHNAQTDTITINRILADEYATEDAGNVERIARLFIGKPYEAGTLEGEREAVRVNLEAFDCTTYVETVLALAYTAGQHRRTWRDFTENLERLRYRNGRAAGYASRLHYPSEWVIDNFSRGNLREITGEIAGARHNVKSLDFMSRNAKLYPALADSATLESIKAAEAGLSNHRYPLLKAPQVKDKTLAPIVRSGDVVLFTTSKSGLDVSHMGFIIMEGGKAMLLHASQKQGKVCIDKLPLAEYVARNRNEGIRIVRLTP